MPGTVGDYYVRHHAGEAGMARYGFTIGGDERGSWFRERLGTGRKVLDLGCRDGTMTSMFISGNEVTGVDVDPQALDLVRRNLGIQAHEVDLNQDALPFDAEAFDAVVAGEVIEHLQFPPESVKEIHRVLKPGGLFLGSVPNAFRLRNRLLFLCGKDFETDPTHLHHFSPSTLRALLSPFRQVAVDYICSRRLWLSRRLMGTIMVWSATK